MNRIVHEPSYGFKPFVIYWIEGRQRVWRCAFHTEAKAQAWIDRYGDLPASNHMQN